MSAAPLGFTALTTRGPLATKAFRLDPLTGKPAVTPYGNAREFSAREAEFVDLEDLFGKLVTLQTEPRTFIVRGQLLEGIDPSRCRRLLYPEVGDDGTVSAPATFAPCYRAWLMCDCDLSPAPEGIDPVTAPEAALDHVLGLLPAGLASADVVYTWGSSQGMKPGYLSLHLFALTDRPYTDAELTRWALLVNAAAGRKLLDPAVYRPVQPHYTAAPTFGPGLVDPLAGRRIGLRKGPGREAVLEIPPAAPAPVRGSRHGLGQAVGFEAHVGRIGTEAGFCEPIKSAIGAYVSVHGARGTDVAALVSTLREAVLEADAGGRSPSEIDRYASERFLRDKIEWTLRRDVAPSSRPFDVGPYEVQHGCIIWKKETAQEVVSVPLTNFTATIAEERTIDDGAERRHVFMVEGALEDGTPLPAAEVPAAQFNALNWIPSAWGARPRLTAGQTVRDRTREAIQLLSPPPSRRTVFQHTGWRRLEDGSWGFLHARGAITARGNRADVDVSLGDLGTLSLVDLPEPPHGDELRDVVRQSVDVLLRIAPLALTGPLLAAVGRAPLCEVVEAPEGLLYVGRTGTGKSELAARGMQFYGPRFHAKGLPAAWADTPNAIERAAFAAKDVVLVVDDFAPAGTREEQARAHANVERIFRAVGNRTGRGRMRGDGTLRPRYVPRGLVVSTAEDLPRMQSARARVLILEVEPGDVDFPTLSLAQRLGADGTFARAMSGYLMHTAGRLEELRATARGRCDELRDLANSSGSSSHRRTPEAVGNLFYGIEQFLAFAVDVEALSDPEAEDLRGKTWEALLEAGSAQQATLEAADPVLRFEALLASAFSSGAVHVKHERTGNAPTFHAEALGWDGGVPRGRCIGWAEARDAADTPGRGLLLDPEHTYAAVQDLAGRQNDPLSVSKGVLWKRLSEAGKLLTRGERTITVRRQGLHGAAGRVNLLHLRFPSGPPPFDSVSQVSHVSHGASEEVAA